MGLSLGLIFSVDSIIDSHPLIPQICSDSLP